MTHPFFYQHPFRAQGRSELEKDAMLALHLVLFLLSNQDVNDGAWRGTYLGTTIKNTCHALEALHLLGRELSAGALEAGAGWLINLPDIFNLPTEDQVSIRLYPSRFKTLAWLGEFDNDQIQTDFQEFEECLDEDGLVQGIVPKPLLATMVYADCLDHLEKSGLLPESSQEKKALALECIQRHVALWHRGSKERSKASLITTEGDLSYAVDLLFRSQRLSKQDEICHKALTFLISTLEQPESLPSISSDNLYCGLQLATHFFHVVEAKEAVRQLINHLRIKYERANLKRETSFFHPLVLRVLLAYHGDALRTEMIRLLLEQEKINLEQRWQSTEQNLKEDLKALLKSRFEVEISEVEPLTGGITRAEVFRVHFGLKFSSIGEGQEVKVDTYHPSPGSLVIKRGTPEALRRSIERYRTLPPALKPYFAKHTQDLRTPGTASPAQSYLVMEDLTYMVTFHDIMNRLDQGVLSGAQKAELERACGAICDGIFSIYEQTRRTDTNFFGSQLSRLYIGGFEKNLIRMCHPDKFPHLKAWLRGFRLGKRKYPSIEHYLRKLERHRAKLKVPYLMLIHGDCHSRNIMLDAQLNQLKLVDLDNLDEDGDYIQDLALLLEDVAVFRFLFNEQYRFHYEKGEVRFVSGSDKQKVIENKIKYRAFSSEAARLCQQYILQNLEEYARSIGDESFRERLWLALALFLMSLVAKQTEKEYATVVYVEAVKLLDELVTHLDKGSPLGTIPFPGKHPAGVEERAGADTETLPAWHQQDDVLTQIHDGLVGLNPTIRYELASSGRIVQYFVGELQRPFGVITGKKKPPALLLACPAQLFYDPLKLAQERKTNSALRTVVEISEQTEVSAVLKLLQQAVTLSDSEDCFGDKEKTQEP